MAIELKQQVRISQQLVMTPQLQQAIKLLQLNQIELVDLVEEELQENPCLEVDDREEVTPQELSDATPGEAEGEGPHDTFEATGNTPGSDDTSTEARSEADEVGETMDFGLDETLPPNADSESTEGPSQAEKIADVEWDAYMDSHPQTGLEGGVRGDDQERPSLESTLTRGPSLTEHLEWQIQLSDFNPDEIAVAEWIIGNLDDRGYLCATLEELAVQANSEVEAVESVLAKVQRLDPPGVAARDLRECLNLQLEFFSIDDPLVVEIVDQHLALLQKRDFRKLTRLLEASMEEVGKAVRLVAGLEPRPARAFGGDDPVYITPDIYVYRLGDEFHVSLNEDGLPRLRVNKVYKNVIGGAGTNAKENRESRDYVQDKVRSAIWLIKSIHQRQQTIYKVTKSILRHQRSFFENGVNCLKPLNLRDVADDIEMHESTVSRVTTNKYVHTPQGIYELKYFFNSSIGSLEGEAVSSEAVKQKIRLLVAGEDGARPLSDQRIAEELRGVNIDIARRTVTKYREQMNILSSSQRREIR